MRHVIGTEMPAARVEPDVVTFNTLVVQLMVEGDAAGAQRVVEEEMPAAGVQPDDRTLETLNRPEDKLRKMRAPYVRPNIQYSDMDSGFYRKAQGAGRENCSIDSLSSP